MEASTIHRIERGLEPRCHNRNRRQRHKHAFHVKQPLYTSLLHNSHHRQQKQHYAPPAQPPKSRFKPVTALALFHVKQLRSSATRHPHPQQRGTRTRAITPNTHTRRSTADTKRGATSRQHPAQSVTNAHTWAPLTHSPTRPRPSSTKAPARPTQTPHTNGRTGPSGPRAPKPSSPRSPQALTPASPAASARGPHASARRPRRARSTR